LFDISAGRKDVNKLTDQVTVMMMMMMLMMQEEQNRGKPNWEHLNEDLHVLISVDDTENRATLKLMRAVGEVKKLLVPMVSGHKSLFSGLDDVTRNVTMFIRSVGHYFPQGHFPLQP